MRRLNSLPMIEPLESRIAPAAIVFVATNFSDVYKNPKTGQVELQFINAASPSANPTTAGLVGDSANVFYIKVSAGEDVKIPTSVGYQNLVNVTKGTVVAFFTDPNTTASPTDAVGAGDLTGLALGTKTSVAIGTAVNGDVLTNYNDATGAVVNNLLPNIVTSLTIAGPVTGAFAAGGTVSRFEATGTITDIYTGSAASGYTYSFDSLAPGGATPGGATTNVLPTITPAAGVAGPSISNVIVGSATNIVLGKGGAGAAGGSISNLTLLADTNGITIQAGAGGSDGAAGKGGAGGSITTVVFNGPSSTAPDTTYNSPIVLIGGAGGNGAGSARGGAGGAVKNLYVDYNSSSAIDPSSSTLLDNVTAQGGAGGTGGTGGAGGSLANINVYTSTYYGGGAPEFQLLAGAGGASPLGGKGGAGGSVTNSTLDNIALPSTDPVTGLPDDMPGAFPASPTNVIALIEGGAGGSVVSRGAGGAGGSVSGLTLTGYNFQIQSGAGGSGVSAGGAGGSIGSVDILGSAGALPGDNFHAQSVVITTGSGGIGSLGKGGAGGSLNGLTIQNADFGPTHMDIPTMTSVANGFQIVTGSGGAAGKGAGGAGGSISNMKVTEVDFLTDTYPLGNTGLASITTGSGGQAVVSGGKGGAGGSISNATIIGTRLEVSNFSTGAGGAGGVSGVAAGKGGAGGKITDVAIRSAEDLFASTATASTGLLLDDSANFVSDNVQVGDTVTNTTNFETTTVTAVSANELTLASDIFAVGDPYSVDGFTGTAMDSQDTIIDSTANYIADGVQPGDVVVDDTDTAANNGVPVTAIVTSVVSATQLDVSADISHVGDQYGIATLGVVHFLAGAGGTGAVNGAGGAGGSILNTSANVPGAVSFLGGAGGGGGATGAAGAGGSLSNDGAISTYASTALQAGSAGSTGGKVGAGGSVTGASLEALTNVSLIAGSGTAGGAGGSVKTSGFSGVLQSGAGFNPPNGNITVQAGAGGSNAVGNGGAGGSISTVTGFVSLGDGGAQQVITQFDAGAGGNGVHKAGAGGSVSAIRFFGGGGEGVTFFINAGDAGNASTGAKGATGGSVTDIGGGTDVSGSTDPNFSLNTLTDFHHISAGDGGNAPSGKGGLGGSVSDVFVNAAIGVRSGVPFGFDVAGVNGATMTGMGGISAGAGGTGSTPGLAGNVTDIAADAIASIVAGHIYMGQPLLATNLATKVDGIILNGSDAPSTVQPFVLNYGGIPTVPIPSNATPLQVASALNAVIVPFQVANNVPQSQQGVTVAAGPNGGYIVTFNQNGAQAAITGTEPTFVTEGTVTEVTQGVPADAMATPPFPGIQEVQSISVPVTPFSLSFGGANTAELPMNATAAQVAAALNALPGIQAAGGVDVTATPGAGLGYTVTFVKPNIEPLIGTAIYSQYSTEMVAGNSTTAEQQNVQVFTANPFTLTFGGDTTGQLPAGATPADVQTALNALPTISNAGGVTVSAGTPIDNPGYNNTATTTNTSYNVTFNDPGAESLIEPNYPVTVGTVQGTSSTQTVETITLPARGDLSPVQLATANFVGGFANPSRPNATIFTFNQLVAGNQFQFGDAPLDGLISAVDLTGNKNFIPEAYVTILNGSAELIDNTAS